MFDPRQGRLTEKLTRIETLLDRLIVHLTRPTPIRNSTGVQVDVRIMDSLQFRGTVRTMTQGYAVVRIDQPAESLGYKYREGTEITLPLGHYSLQTVDTE